MPQYHTTSDPETILPLPLTAKLPKHSFHWQDKPAMFFIPPNHLPAKSIHLDHCLLRVFESLLPFLPHTICLFPLAPSQQPTFNHFFITPPSLSGLSTLISSLRLFPLLPVTLYIIHIYHTLHTLYVMHLSCVSMSTWDSTSWWLECSGVHADHAWFTATRFSAADWLIII